MAVYAFCKDNDDDDDDEGVASVLEEEEVPDDLDKRSCKTNKQFLNIVCAVVG
jgi:hypothetical protein